MIKKVLIVCHDTVGSKMAGPGIRYQNIANQIKRVADVTLGVFSDSKDQENSELVYVKTTDDSYKLVFDKYDVIFAQWLSGKMLEYAKNTGKVVIFDLYAPVPIEYLASLGFSQKNVSAEQDLEFSGVLETYKQYLSLGDFFVCSNERQRDFWLGFITSSNILRPTNFTSYAKMDNIALCPMGISSIAPSVKSLKLRKRIGLAKDDFVLLWTGGIWDWFDAHLVIKAVHKLNNPRIKLVFMGTVHPNSKVPEMAESKAARTLAKDLKLIDESVFFLDGWVDYDDRASYLLDADVAIYADKDSVETRFSHRTRVLDHIWAGLPTICSKGDYLSDVLDSKGMGIVVEKREPESFAIAIDKAFSSPKSLTDIKSNIDRERSAFTWEELSRGLLHFIEECKPGQPVPAEQPKTLTSRNYVKYNKRALRRIKNSLKVLLGRIDV